MGPSGWLLLAVQALLVCAAAALGQSLGLWLARWPMRGAPADGHWSERARRSWSARLVCALGPFAAAAFAVFQADRFAPVPFARLVLGIAAAVGAVAATVPVLSRILQRRMTWRGYVSEILVTLFVMQLGLLVLLVMMFLLVGELPGPRAYTIVATSALLIMIVQTGMALPLLHPLGLFAPAPERLKTLVAAAAARADMAPPAVYLLRREAANAFAFPWQMILAFTPACLQLLTDDELQAVASHELAHLQESRGQKLMRALSVFLYFPVFTMPMWTNRYGSPGLFVPVALMLVASQLSRRFSQKMERRADAAAYAQATNEKSYASALEKLYAYNLVPAVMPGKRQAHPHLYDRLLATGLEPAYPRPAPPRRWLVLPAMLLLYLTVQSPRLLHLRHKFQAAVRQVESQHVD